MITTDMQALIDWDAIMPMPRCAFGHDEQMKALFKGARALAHWNDGGHHGVVATAVKLADGRYCWYQDSYGSCRGCDAWEDASDKDVHKLCIDLANSARVFNTLEDMKLDIQYVMSSKEKGSWWQESARELFKLLEQPQA